MRKIDYFLIINFAYAILVALASFISLDTLLFAISTTFLLGEPLTLYCMKYAGTFEE